MYGAILGDIIGSRFEFDRGGKTKDFKLFMHEDSYTDDTVMTVAVAEGLLQAGKTASLDEIRRAVTRSMRKWGRRYPYAGYGNRFCGWLFSGDTPAPYNSCGNGSAMRVSAAGWLYDTLEHTREVARAAAEVTHNHPEGIKGAECTAAVIYMSRTGRPKDEIKAYVTREFGYDLSRTVDELRPLHRHVETCQDSLPKALVSFFEGVSYEDVVRNAVSLGGDTDTIGAIAGSMAEAFYGVPVMLAAKGKTYLPEDMLAVLNAFDTAIGRTGGENAAGYEDNQPIKTAIARAYRQNDSESLLQLLNALLCRMDENGEAPTPMVDVDHVMDTLDPDALTLGGTFSPDRDMRLRMDTMRDSAGNEWFPLFTDMDELHKGQTTNISLNVSIRTILENGLHSGRVSGVVINPFGQAYTLDKAVLELLLRHCEDAPHNAEK